MDVDDDINRLARKGLAEGLSDEEIFELLTDHDIPQDEAKTILDDVKDALSTPNQSAREALVNQTPDVSSGQESTERSNAEDKFEQAFAEEVEQPRTTDITEGKQADKRAEDDESDSEAPSTRIEEDQSFDDFSAEIEKDDEPSSEGIFDKLTNLFTSSDKTTRPGDQNEAYDDGEENTQIHQGPRADNNNQREQKPQEEDHDWDAEALKELAREAIDKGLAEEEILSLFLDHGVPESYTKQLLEEAKQEHDESLDQDDQGVTEGDSSKDDRSKAEALPADESDNRDGNGSDDINDLELEDLAEEENNQATSEQSFEKAFDEDMQAEKSDAEATAEHKVEDGQGENVNENDVSSRSGEKPKRSTSEKRRATTVSADQLDEETLQAMAQHGIAKGFDRAELVNFFKDHGVKQDRAMSVVDSVIPSDNQNTTGREKSEQEGQTGLSEAKDAVAVQKQEQMTAGDDEDESFMSDMDKSQESLKVGRVYLTGRKPSYGRMRVRGLQDITGNEFESGSREGFIDLSDTDEHIEGDGEQAVEEGQQIEDDRIREES